MEMLFRENYDEFYVCTDEELEEIRNKYKNHQNRIENNGCYYENTTVFYDNCRIVRWPSTLHLDGYLVKGGRYFDAIGIKVGRLTTSGYDWRCYFKKENITKNEPIPTEEWWA